MGGGIILGVAIYLAGAYVAAFLTGLLDIENPDAVAVFWPVSLGFVVGVAILAGPVKLGMVIYGMACKLRDRC